MPNTPCPTSRGQRSWHHYATTDTTDIVAVPGSKDSKSKEV